MGSSGGIPDIGVRLSAQGVNDVVLAFQRVRQEGKKTGVETAAGLELINGALRTLRDLLPAISFAIAVEKLVEVGLSARETAENMGKLSAKTGAAIGTLSVLNLAAHDSEVGQDALSGSLIKLAKNQEDATNGSAKQLKAFKDIKISVADLKNQDPGQLFVSVAQKLDAIPDGAHKAQIAIALFGKTGADLLPMLKSLGKDGFEQALDKAKKLGIYLDGDMVQSAAAAQDALHEIGDIANGVATQFVSGFAPQFTSGIEILSEGLMGDGVKSVQTFGDVTGRIFKALTLDLLVILDTAKFVFTSFTSGIENVWGQSKSFLQGVVAGGGVAGGVAGVIGYNTGGGANFAADQDKRRQDYIDSIKKIRAEANVEPTRTASTIGRGGTGGSGDGTNPLDNKAAAARSAYLQSLSDNELAILKLKNQLEEAEDQRHYATGDLTLDQYYDRREQRIKEEADKELQVLRDKLATIDALPAKTPEQESKKLQAAAAVETQITETQLREQGALKAVEDNRAKDRHDSALAEMSNIQKLKQLSGDRYGAQETALNIELQQYTELLQKQGKSVEQIEAAVDAYARRGQAAIDFGRNQEAGSSAMTNLNLGIGNIQNQAASGSISNVAAQAQINQLQKDNLSTLAEIGRQMFVNAALSGNTKSIDTANQYNAAVQRIASSLTNVTTAQTYLINQLTGQGISSITEFFTAGISGSKSFGDALGDLANTFENIVSSMIAKLLVYYSVMSLIGWVSGDSDIGESVTKSIFPQGPLGSHDDGGWTGNGPINRVSGVVHGQEFVIKAGPAAAYRPFLEAINAGQTPSIRSVSSSATSSSSSYADSVSAGGGMNVPAPQIQVINTTGQPTSQKQTTGPGGESITQIIVGKVAADIAAGGQVAKTLQANYGLSRQGVRRG